MTDNKCKYCLKTFLKPSNSKRHERGCSKNPEKYIFNCDRCGQTYARFDSCKKHVINCSATCRKGTGCLHPNCSAKFYRKISLIEHLKNFHGVNIEDPKELNFDSAEAFKIWKEEEEERTYSYYSKATATKGNTDYYSCQHNGSGQAHRKHGEDPRKTNRKHRKGQIKTGKTCIANMKVTTHDDNCITVKYQPVHCHPLQVEDFQYHPLSTSTKEFITQQLAMGIPPRKIANKLKDDSFHISPDGELPSVGKDSFANTHRIRGIALRTRRKMRIHEDDAISITMLVQKLLKEENSPIILYKPVDQGKHVGPESINQLKESKELFMLGIQTQEQKEMMKLGSQKILSVDVMHGTNQYGYQLLNLVVPDEYHRGYPVGHFIASILDKETISCFFEALKGKCPELVINCVITDDNPVIIDGISDVFGENLRHILCMWHLHRSFQRQLRKLAPNNLVNEMYQGLCLIMDSRSELVFQTLSVEFQEKYIKKAPHFIEYFAGYFERSHKWAMCYRTFPHGNIDTTLLNELIHNRLKATRQMVNRRVDDLINMLLLIEEDDCTHYQTEEILGVPFGLRETTDSRHKRGLEINNKDVVNFFKGHWEVVSQSNKAMKYKVVRCAENCTSDRCLFSCKDGACYKLCAHLYFCTCPDKSPMCKHIHKVHSLTTCFAAINMDTDEIRNTEDLMYCSKADRENPNSIIEQKYKIMKLSNIKNNLLELTELLEKERVQNTLLNHIDSAVFDLLHVCKAVDIQEPVSSCNDSVKRKLKQELSSKKKEKKTRSNSSTYSDSQKKDSILQEMTFSEANTNFEFVFVDSSDEV